jgi:ABC-type cobalamin/Fe3+-siderophores transport system ATPase subunit
VESICLQISPSQLADLVLFQEPSSAADSFSLEGISRDTLEDIFRHLRQQPSKSLLELHYEYPREDKPVITYRLEKNNYRELSQLSAGQKMTALQMIILALGDLPVIIDQPEDSIDTTSVYLNIVQKLRSGKLKRQFILSSHNPNIVVTGDSDKISILDATATNGRIAESGSLDREVINDQAILHLEGGEKALSIRTDKYEKKQNK